MGESHNCDCKPDSVDMYKSDSGWVLYFGDSGNRGYDEEVFMNVTIRIPIEFCPFCGAKVVGA